MKEMILYDHKTKINATQHINEISGFLEMSNSPGEGDPTKTYILLPPS